MLALGLAGTLLWTAATVKRARSAAQLEFEESSRSAARQVEQSFKAPLEALHAIHALGNAWSDIDQRRFELFAAELIERYPSLAALELFDVVRGEERADFERRVSARTGRPFTFTEPADDGSGRMIVSPPRHKHVVLTRLLPFQPALHGLDIMFDPLRREQIEVATHSGGPVVTSKFRLVEDPPGVYSVAVYDPIYADIAVPTQPGEREGRLRAFAIALYRLTPLMNAALIGTTLQRPAVALIDDDPQLSPEDALLFGKRAPTSGAGFTQRHPIHFAGRAWTLETFASPPDTLAAATPSLLTGLIGSALASLLAGVFVTLRRSRQRLHALQAIGPYTIVREVGGGGMGRVFEARHRLLRRKVALKVIAQPRASAEQQRRFELEAKITSELCHPNTVAVFDYGRTLHGDFYYAMEYVNGIDFEQLVHGYGPQPAARVRHLLVQVCGALAEAHGLGLVHRDIKPGNLMVAVNGGIFDFVKVLDFGLVRVTRGGESVRSSSKGLLGTPRYMAPEAFASAQSGPRSDLYGLGCVAYYLLSGKEPFAAKTDAAIAALHLTQPPRPLRELGIELPPAFERIVLRCLAKSPDDRFGSAAQLMRALSELELPAWTQSDAAAFWAEFGARQDAKSDAPAAPS